MRQYPQIELEVDSNEVWNGSYNINYNYKRDYPSQTVGKDPVKVLGGHFIYDKYKDRKGSFITFLRNPIDRVISHYLHYKSLSEPRFRNLPEKVWFGKREMNIEEFACITPNLMTFHTGGNLEVFDFIGILEQFDSSISRFNKRFGLNLTYTTKRVVGHFKEEITKKQRDMIKEINMLDMELYKEALEIVKRG